jgi:hypothetical protein
MIRTRLPALLGCALLASCGSGSTDSSGSVQGIEADLRSGVLFVASNSQSAVVRLLLTSQDDTCASGQKRVALNGVNLLQVALAIVAPNGELAAADQSGTYSINAGSGPGAKLGGARFTDLARTCGVGLDAPATAGQVTLHHVALDSGTQTVAGLRGEFQLTFQTSTIEGRFDVATCPGFDPTLYCY